MPRSSTRRRGRSGLATMMIAGLVAVVALGWYWNISWLFPGVLGVLTLGGFVWLYREGNPLVGPIFRIDLVRTSRQGRLILFRCGYALALLVVLYLLYARWFPGAAFLSWEPAATPRIPLKEAARFAESFLHAFLLAQLAAVFLFTPAYVAGVIAEEKDRRTLDFLLVCDLTDREIVLSKLASRLLHLTFLLLTGLPVLLFLVFLGGIDPELLLAGFLSNGFTMLSLAGTSLLCSVYAERTLTAMLSAYLVAAGHLFCCGVGCLQPLAGPQTVYAPLALLFEAGPVLGILFSGLFHGWVAAVFCHWAILRMRPWYRIRASLPAEPVPPSHIPPAVWWEHKQMGDDPLEWKERHITPPFGLSVAFRAGFARYAPLVPALLFLLVVLVFSWINLTYSGRHGVVRGNQITYDLLNGTSTSILCVMILLVGIHAAYSLGSERDRRTLEPLLATPLETRDILAAKWQASFLSVRKGWWLLLALVWLPSAVACGLHWVTMPLLVLAGGVYMAFAASLGLWCALVCRTTTRAIVWTLVVLFAVSIFPPFQVFSPPATLTTLAFWADPRSFRSPIMSAEQVFIIPILGLYGLTAWLLWTLTNHQFGRITGRMPYGRDKPGRSP